MNPNLPPEQLHKIQAWRAELAKFIENRLGQPFCWGRTNCVSLALRAIDVQCNSRLMMTYFKHLRERHLANLWVAEHGLAELVTLFESHGAVQLTSLTCTDGDLIFLEDFKTICSYVICGKATLSSTVEAGVQYHEPVEVILAKYPKAVILGVREGVSPCQQP